MEQRENVGYVIVEALHIGKAEFVIGENPKAPAPYVTWECNEEYAALSEQMSVMRKQHPFILNLDEGDGAITLSAEEHEAYLAYIGLMHQTEDMERLQIYFRGHTDAVAYLQKIKVI